LIDELLQNCPERPTQEDLFGPDGVVKQLAKALIERYLVAELTTHLGYEKRGTPTHEVCGGVRHVQRQSAQVYRSSGRRVR